MHRQAKYSFLLAMLSATCGRYLCEGLVIPFPGGNADADVSKSLTREEDSQHWRNTRSTASQRRVRIRQTSRDHIEQVSSLLATAWLDDNGVTGGGDGGWKYKMEHLRSQASYRTQLYARLNALDAGRRAARRAQSALVDKGLLYPSERIDSTLSHPDGARLMWSDANFVSRLRRAVDESRSVPNMWAGHEFVTVPDGISGLLRHVMISAEEVSRKGDTTVAGFCEVAILPLPDGEGYEPMVANLVTSKDHRRMGVASSLLKAAFQYVRAHWGDEDQEEGTKDSLRHSSLGLYVDRDNAEAKSLYQGKGFAHIADCSHSPNLLYMQKILA